MLVLLEMIPLASRSGTWRKCRLSGSRDRRLEVARALHRRRGYNMGVVGQIASTGASLESRAPLPREPKRHDHSRRKYPVPLSGRKFPD